MYQLYIKYSKNRNNARNLCNIHVLYLLSYLPWSICPCDMSSVLHSPSRCLQYSLSPKDYQMLSTIVITQEPGLQNFRGHFQTITLSWIINSFSFSDDIHWSFWSFILLKKWNATIFLIIIFFTKKQEI